MAIDGFFGDLPMASVLLLFGVSLIAGMARGFAGFGAGLIVMPVASALTSPLLAVAIFSVADFVLAAPMLPGAFRKCDWSTVLPAAVAALLFVPVGVFVLVHNDPLLVRWGLSVAILIMLMLLLSGWRYTRTPHFSASATVGALSGFLSGAAQIPGPPIVTYWMSGPAPAATIRANLITYFLFTSIAALVSYFGSGILTLLALKLVVLIAPAYGGGIWLGARLHPFAPEKWFRRVVYGLILIAALTSLPAFDGLLRQN